MPVEADSATATATETPAATPAPDSGAAPAAAVTSTPETPASSTPSAETAASPVAPIDVHADLMKAATAAVQKANGQPSAQQDSLPGAVDGTTAKPEAVADKVKAEAEAKAKAEAEDDSKPPPFNDHPRWKKLERDYARANDTVKALQPRAEQYDKITAYMEQFSLTPDDVAMAYDILAKMKTNPMAAYQTVKPIWEQLSKAAGEVLPDDLQKKVREGFMDEPSAREVARARAAQAISQADVKRAGETVRQTQHRQNATAIQSAVALWDRTHTGKNPDFERLRPMVEDAARTIMAKEGKATTPEAAVAVLDRALKVVNDRLAIFRPKPNGATPLTPNANTPSTATVAPEPKSLAEAMKQGLEGRYRFAQ